MKNIARRRKTQPGVECRRMMQFAEPVLPGGKVRFLKKAGFRTLLLSICPEISGDTFQVGAEIKKIGFPHRYESGLERNYIS